MALSPQAQRWIEEHPAFETDGRYRAACIGAHVSGCALGIQPDSFEYFEHLNRELDARYGTGHGQAGMDHRNSRERRSAGGGETVETPAGAVTVREKPDGRTVAAMGEKTREEIESHARACGMSVAEYTAAQIAIARGDSDEVTGRRVPRAREGLPPFLAADAEPREPAPAVPEYLRPTPAPDRGDRPWLRRT